MKIVYYTRGLPRSTHEVYMEHTAEALRRAGDEIVTCYPIGSERASRAGSARPAGNVALRTAALRRHLPRIAWNVGQLLANRMSYRPLLEKCSRERPDLIHESYLPFGTAGIGVARKLDIPLLLGIHEHAQDILDLIGVPLKGYAAELDRKVTLASDGVMCITNVLRERVLSWGYPEERALVLHNAVSPEAYQGGESKRRETRAQIGADDAFVIGYLQAWNALERFDEMARMLLETMDLVLAQLPRAVFLLVGGGLLLDRLQQRIHVSPARRQAVRLVGQVGHQEVPGYLAAMDAAMCPEHSTFTSPMKLFEYMATGLPIVAPRQPNVEEILDADRTALLFPPGDPAALAQGLIRLARSPQVARAIGAAARGRVLERHTWEAYGRSLSGFAEHIRQLPRRASS